jgi:hypothetical protein
MPRITIRCAACGSDNVMRDASARWDYAGQTWSLSDVFDAAFCDSCEGDASLVELPLPTSQSAAPPAEGRG